MLKKVLITLAIIALLVVLSAAALLHRTVFAPLFEPERTTFIYIDRDDTPDSVITQLNHAAYPRNLWGMRLLMRYRHYDERMRTGRYAVRPGESAYDVFCRILRGYQEPMNLTVGSTRSLGALARHVARQIMIDSTEVAHALHDSLTIARLGYSPQTLPALFIPNTYQVYWDLSADDLLNRMLTEHERWWTTERQQRANELGLTPLDVSTLASIVEEETNLPDEKPIVAGLYLNRLRRGMLLQADPTVKFANGDPTLRRITYDLLTIDSPYNTYLYPGLPPGPIRIPSPEGLLAVLHAKEHNFLYMCAREDLSGAHRFAATLAEHNRNAARYRAALNARRIYK